MRISKILFPLSLVTFFLLAKPAQASWADFAAKFIWEGTEYAIDKYSESRNAGQSNENPSPNSSSNPSSNYQKAVPWKVCVEDPGDDRLYVNDSPDWTSPEVGVLTDGEEILQIDEEYAQNGKKWAQILYKRQGSVKSGWVNKGYLMHPEDTFANCWR